MKLAMLDKGSKLVAVRECGHGGVLGEQGHGGRLMKAHIAPVSLGNSDGRLMVLVVKWVGVGRHDAGSGAGRGGTGWYKPVVAVYVGRCNEVIDGGSADGGKGTDVGRGVVSLWDVVELIRYEVVGVGDGSGRVADSVRHFGQLVSQSLVGA